MTVSTTAAKVVLSGNGATTSFGFNFYIPNQASLVVQTVDSSGNITTLTSGQYSVTGLGTSTGSVTISPAPATGVTVVISRSIPLTQNSDFTNQDGFYPEVIESGLDLLTMMIQNSEAISRSIKSSIADTGVLTLPTAAARASKVLGFDGSGNPIPAGNVSDLASLSAAVASAQGYAVAAAAARDAALASYTSFVDHYIGASATDPTQNADGTALVGGELYFNTVSQGMKIWTGSAWVNGYVQAGSYLAIGNNLSDLANAGTARNNLSLGTSNNVQFNTVADTKGELRRAVLNNQTGAYTLVASDAGKSIWLTSSGAPTVPTGVFTGGDMVTIINNTGSAKTITQGTSISLVQAGTGTTGNRTLADSGIATIIFVSSTYCYISGAGLT